jgi:hypothetical protein
MRFETSCALRKDPRRKHDLKFLLREYNKKLGVREAPKAFRYVVHNSEAKMWVAMIRTYAKATNNKNNNNKNKNNNNSCCE